VADLDQVLATARDALDAEGRAYALVGGLAVSVRGEVRFTRDVDLAVVVQDDRDAERLVWALAGRGFRPVASVEHESVGRLATVRLGTPSGVVVDLLFASSGIEAEVVASADPVDLPGVGPFPVARAEALVALKVLSMSDVRLQDRLDVLGLLSAGPVDLGAVRTLLAAVRARGFDRGKALEAELEACLRLSGRQTT
jgi:hypothetical protein